MDFKGHVGVEIRVREKKNGNRVEAAAATLENDALSRSAALGFAPCFDLVELPPLHSGEIFTTTRGFFPRIRYDRDFVKA